MHIPAQASWPGATPGLKGFARSSAARLRQLRDEPLTPGYAPARSRPSGVNASKWSVHFSKSSLVLSVPKGREKTLAGGWACRQVFSAFIFYSASSLESSSASSFSTSSISSINSSWMSSIKLFKRGSEIFS